MNEPLLILGETYLDMDEIMYRVVIKYSLGSGKEQEAVTTASREWAMRIFESAFGMADVVNVALVGATQQQPNDGRVIQAQQQYPSEERGVHARQQQPPPPPPQQQQRGREERDAPRNTGGMIRPRSMQSDWDHIAKLEKEVIALEKDPEAAEFDKRSSIALLVEMCNDYMDSVIEKQGPFDDKYTHANVLHQRYGSNSNKRQAP